MLGDFDLAEEAVQEAFIVALERWPDQGVPDNPTAWIIRVGRNKAIDRLRRERVLAEKTALAGGVRAGSRGGDRPQHGGAAGRPVAADVHGGPSRDHSRGTSRAHAAHAGWAHDRRDRAGVPRPREHDGAAARASEAQDQGGGHPVRGSGARAAPCPPALGAGDDLPRLQRGVCGVGGRRARAPRALRRGDQARPGADGADARGGRGRGPLGPDAPARRAPRRARRRRGGAGAARTSGPFALGPPADRRGRRAHAAGARARPPLVGAPARPLRAAGDDRGGARHRPPSRGHALGPDPPPLRLAVARPALSGDRAEPRRGDRDGGGAGGRPRCHRSHRGARRVRPPPHCPRRPAAAPGAARGSDRGLSAGAGAHSEPGRAVLPGAATGRD